MECKYLLAKEGLIIIDLKLFATLNANTLMVNSKIWHTVL